MKSTILLFVFGAVVFLAGIGETPAQQSFTRMTEIEVPQIENCGFGNFISGVDFDEDGQKEIYAVNNMHDLGGNELVPRIYKFEYNGGTWDSVWSATMVSIGRQNSWPALTHGDWDKDGKPELIWGPVNNLSSDNSNPPRILVFEAAGDGSDQMGVFSFGNYEPNAQWTITDEDMMELRPVIWELTDIDGDSEEELCFASRRENYRFGIVSVDNIPDDGGGSEEWTLEFSGFEQEMDEATIYDMAVIDNTLFLFHSNGTINLVEYSDGSYQMAGEFSETMPGGSWQSACSVDINEDGEKEIMVAGWTSGNNNIYLVEEDSFVGVKVSTIANLSSHIGSAGRFNGGDHGDIDADGDMDFVFGTRGATPDAAIVRVEHQGGNLTDSANYTYSVIDSLYEEGTNLNRYDGIDIANIDDDELMEVTYSDNIIEGRIPLILLKPDAETSVASSDLPAAYSLSQNYPNPFNPTTNIEFSLKQSEFVNLSVYNMLGQKVAELVNGERAQGKHKVKFNATRLSSGVYIYKLKTRHFETSQKLMLLR